MNFAALLNWAVLTVSFYNTISLLWLGVMVLLIGNRRSAGTWLTAAGLLAGALFFTSHTAIIGRGLATTGFGMNFWWFISWMPAVMAPFAWYAAMSWHTGLGFGRRSPHRGWLLAMVGLLLLTVLLLIFANPLPLYHYVAGRVIVPTASVDGIPLLILVYMIYSLLSYLLPLDLLRRAAPQDGEENPLVARSRHLARPWLVAASVSMLLAGIILGWTALWALMSAPIPSLTNPEDLLTVLKFDVAVSVLVALAITLLGRAIVAYEVFTGRPMPRDRFYNQWRSAVTLAAGFGLVSAWSLVIDLRPIYTLMLATALMTIFYALFAWRSYSEREQFMARLRPFVASQNLYGRLTEPQLAEDHSVDVLFQTICREILEVRVAVLAPLGPLATLAGPPLVYPQGSGVQPPALSQIRGQLIPATRCLPVKNGELVWAVLLWGEHGLSGVLFLGEKLSRGPYNEEEIEVAQAGGERLLDVMAGSELARLALDLLRERVVRSRVLEGQGRRVLHDEVLPELHTAVLYLSGQASSSPEVGEAVETLSAAHRRISNLLREAAPGAPARLAQEGLASALQALLAGDFISEFQSITWDLDADAALQAQRAAAFAVEVVYFAARELVRNAARYGRGGEAQRALNLTVRLKLAGERLRLMVEDDGVGVQQNKPEVGGGAGSGLRIHSAMLAAVGASLEVSPRSGGGTCGVILF